ncbi:MAG: glycosyltransferase N-terminal domain-containing protein [Bacteroidota bacterium]
MRILYTFIVQLVWLVLKPLALVFPKMRLFVHGRQQTFATLQESLQRNDRVLWIHAASLGEYEQGLPVIQALKKQYPEHKILLSFFSPSGYEVKKQNSEAHCTVYLPMDTRRKAEQFVETVRPELALFIKYEIWPNYLNALQKRGVPTLLISGIFKANKVYFKWYGGFLRRALTCFTHFFVQDAHSKQLLESLGLAHVTISGDTRFDRVAQIAEGGNTLPFAEQFTQGLPCLVAGSTWPEDEKILIPFINATSHPLKFIIAPHQINKAHIDILQKALSKKVIRYSQMKAEQLPSAEVLIIDTIGLLTTIYRYANLAYVGGGFATGLHNTLEPAVFGIPVIIGPKYKDFNEAVDMVNNKGVLSIETADQFSKTVDSFLANPNTMTEVGNLNNNYIQQQRGATNTVIDYIATLL